MRGTYIHKAQRSLIANNSRALYIFRDFPGGEQRSVGQIYEVSQQTRKMAKCIFDVVNQSLSTEVNSNKACNFGMSGVQAVCNTHKRMLDAGWAAGGLHRRWVPSGLGRFG